MPPTRGTVVSRIAGVSVTPSLLGTLGIRPLAGREMNDSEGHQGGPEVALITYELWQHRYGGDRSIIGQVIGVNGRATTIIGILPAGIHFAGDAQVWSSLTPYRPRPTPRFMEAIARLEPGSTPSQAQAEMDFIARTIAAEFPDSNADWSVGLRTLPDDLTGNSRPALVMLLFAVGLLLLIACANVANLLLAHASARQREVAVRAALGASTGRLVRQFFTESLLLAFAGGGAGLLIAVAGVRAVRAFAPTGVPRIQEVAMNLPVLLYSLAISIAAGILFGMAPVLRMRKPELALAMKEGSRTSTAGPGDLQGRGLLVVAQVSLAVLLVNSAGLLIKSFIHLTSVNPGFRTEHVLTANVSLPNVRYAKPEDVTGTFDRLLTSIRAVPGVKAAGTTTSLPLAQDLDYRLPFRFLSLPAPQHLEDQTAWHRMVSPGVFQSLGTPLTAGRDFTEHDRTGSTPVVVINETLARQYWPQGNVIGQRLRGASGGFGPLGTILVRDPEVIGVVADILYTGLGKPAEPAIYFSTLQAPFFNVSLVVRTDASLQPEMLISAVRSKLREIDPELPLAHVRAMSEQVAEAVAQPRFQAILLAAFSSLALLLGAVGIYGVLSYSVVIRTREIGIRTALGGQPSDIQKMILGQGLRLVMSGLTIGIALSLVSSRLLQKLLFQVGSFDLGTYVAVAVVLAAVGLLAGYLPARTASRIEPSIALRES